MNYNLRSHNGNKNGFGLNDNNNPPSLNEIKQSIMPSVKKYTRDYVRKTINVQFDKHVDHIIDNLNDQNEEYFDELLETMMASINEGFAGEIIKNIRLYVNTHLNDRIARDVQKYLEKESIKEQIWEVFGEIIQSSGHGWEDDDDEDYKDQKKRKRGDEDDEEDEEDQTKQSKNDIPKNPKAPLRIRIRRPIKQPIESKDEKDVLQVIESLETSEENKKILRIKYNSFKSDPDEKERTWLNIALALPYDKKIAYPLTKSSSNLQRNTCITDMIESLNENIHALDKPKEEIILEMLKRMTLDGKINGKILLLAGPPGIGKTHFAQCLAEALDLPFSKITLGGSKDSHELLGFSPCYKGSHPGKIVNALKELKCSNGIIYLDEIDKLTGTRAQEVVQSLLSILDETQNYEWKDNYLESIKINLSNILFIASANDVEQIDPVLKDRLKIIQLEPPTPEDKIQLVRKYFLPQFCKMYNVELNDINLSNDMIKYIIQNKTKDEKGVRELKRNIDRIVNILFVCKNVRVESKSPPKTKKQRLEPQKIAKLNPIQFNLNDLVTMDLIDNVEEDKLEEGEILQNYDYGSLKFSFLLKNIKFPMQLNRDIIDQIFEHAKTETLSYFR